MLSLTDARYILEAPKRLVVAGPWTAAANREIFSQVLSCEAQIEIDGVLPRGVWIRSSVILAFPDFRNVSIGMRYSLK